MSDFYEKFPTTDFKISLSKSRDELNQIGNGTQAGEAYNVVVRRLWVLANHRQLTRFNFETHGQVRYAVAALVQERGEVVGDDDLLARLIKNSRFEALMAELLAFEQEGFDVNAVHQRLTPKLLNLYYQRYFSFEASIADDAVRSALLVPLKQMLRRYDGRHRMTVLARSNTPLLEGKLDKVLLGFDDVKPLDEIRAKLILSNNHEIFQRLRLLRLLANIRALRANQYDVQVKQLFADVKQYPYVWANAQRLILEECVREMLLKCERLNEVCEDWQQFIFETIGDPRSFDDSVIQSWGRVGRDLYDWYLGLKSRGDLLEFLNIMTDKPRDAIVGGGNEADNNERLVYPYRRQFWLQYVPHAKRTKIMLGGDNFLFLQKKHPKIAARFSMDKQTYSTLEERKRSCVYVDFGGFCIIEGTHDASIRIYQTPPIDLTDSKYRYTEFHQQVYSDRPEINLLKEFRHVNSENYAWQNRVRVLLNQWITPPITLESILLPADQTPQRIAQIRDYLLRRQNQN